MKLMRVLARRTMLQRNQLTLVCYLSTFFDECAFQNAAVELVCL